MYRCTRFDRIIFGETQAVWNRQLNELVGSLPRAHHEGILGWVEKHLNDPGPYSYAYALIRENEAYACAVLDVSYAHVPGNSWLKMLQVCTEPRIDASVASGDEGIKELSHVAANALVNVFGLTYEEHPCNCLKVYGRTPLTVEFLEGVAGNLPQLEGFGLRVYSQAGWLIFDKSGS